MSWFRVGDTAATDPRRLALNDPKDPSIGLTCFGFLVELGTLSASNKTDYVLTQGFLILAGGPAWQSLLKRCVRAGLIIPLDGRGADKRWKLIDDAPELFHIRLKDEVAWERQQKADNDNDRNRIAAFLRDGDACRYCRVPVQPNDNKSGRGRTLDHIRPGEPARTPEDLVVCCRSCNGKRGRDWQNEDARPGFASRWPLLLPPSPLIFCQSTVAWLAKQGQTIPDGSIVTDRALPSLETPSGPGPAATHPANAGVATSPTSPSAPGATHPAAAGVAAPESRIDRSATDRSGTPAPGRAGIGSGSGRVGSSPRASPADPSSSPARRTRRGRRGSRSGGMP